MKMVTLFLLAFILIACSDENKTNPSEELKEEVLIEQNDEKTEVNDTNVPLPVGEPLTHLQNEIYALSFIPHLDTPHLLNWGGGGIKKNDTI